MDINVRFHGCENTVWMTVSRENFFKLKGTYPNEKYDASYCNVGMYKIYMRDSIPELSAEHNGRKDVQIKIERFELQDGEVATVIRTKRSAVAQKEPQYETPVDFL